MSIQYETDAADMLAVAYLENRGDEFNAACKVLAGVMEKRDEDVRFLHKELQARAASPILVGQDAAAAVGADLVKQVDSILDWWGQGEQEVNFIPQSDQIDVKGGLRKLRAALAAAASIPVAGVAAETLADFTLHYRLPVAVREASTKELEICDAKGYGICYFSGMDSDKHVADFMVAAINAAVSAPAAAPVVIQAGGAGYQPIYPGADLPEIGERVVLLNNYGSARLAPVFGRLGEDEGGYLWQLDGDSDAWAFTNFTHYHRLGPRPTTEQTIHRARPTA